MALDTIDNIHTLARILQSEASVGNASEQTAVGWTVLNRMMRNRTGNSLVPTTHQLELQYRAA
jgi:hypothetical protein